MDAENPRKRETEALIEAIWGLDAVRHPHPADPTIRERQNEALAAAMKAYLSQYLEEL